MFDQARGGNKRRKGSKQVSKLNFIRQDSKSQELLMPLNWGSGNVLST
jgi:hypothetical protein